MKYFKSLFYPILTAVFVFACSSGKTIDAPSIPPKEVNDEKLSNALLWEISGNNLPQKSYLYGTIHIINDEDFFYPKGTDMAIGNVKRMVFEIDMKEMNDMSKAMGMLQKAYMNDGLTLKDLLSPEDYKLVSNHFQEIGLPLFFLERIKPMFLSVFASGDLSPEDLQSGKIKSYEMEFAKTAEAKGLETGGLESMDFQIGLFDEIPYEDQAAMLVESIRSSNTGSDQFKEMVDIYKNQDINAMQELMKTDETIEEYEDVLLVKRNKNWIPIMKEMMSTTPTFFAVGAGHLGGDFGVIELLKKEGYSVKPVIAI